MKRLFSLGMIAALLTSLLNFQSASSAPNPKHVQSKTIPQTAVLQLVDGLSIEEDSATPGGYRFKTQSPELNAVLKQLDVQTVKPLFPLGKIHKIANDNLSEDAFTRTYLLRFKKSADIDAAITTLSSSADVAFVEYDYYADTLDYQTPNDPRYMDQWALTAIDAPIAWSQLPSTAPKVTVAVIDSGICSTHPDLVGRILSGWDFLESDDTPQDQFGHGCSVSGVIAANMNNGIGISGIAPNAEIMPLRVLNANGVGSFSDVASAIVYAADHGAQVINLSLGGSSSSTLLENAVNYAITKGVVVVASAGNSGKEGILYPAAYPGVIAVGSLDPNLQQSSFSNYGPEVDLWAPGRDILTTGLDDDYVTMSGSSFAAPYVAGAWAMEIALGEKITADSDILSFNTEAAPTETPIPVTPIPTFTPLPTTENPTDPSNAGAGTLYRAQILLKYPADPARLDDWGIKILNTGNQTAVIQATQEQLARLARLGFEPTQIDSVEYMLAVQSAGSGTALSISDVTSSSAEMLALSSVDSDSDGLTDTEESWWCTNPNDNNSDSPLEPTSTNPSDGDEVDAILSGITAYGPPFALWPQFTPYNPNGNCPDGDFDGVPDYAEEFMIGTSNLRESSDKDKFDDGQELFGVTFCPAASGPCGYGILPRAEDAAFVSANLPAWVKAPGNSPFVAAFPEPEVEVLPSSIVMTQKTVITNTKGTTVGTEKTYGTSSTDGVSSSITNTTTWNNWEEVSITTELTTLDGPVKRFRPYEHLGEATIKSASGFGLIYAGCVASAATVVGFPVGCATSAVIGLGAIAWGIWDAAGAIQEIGEQNQSANKKSQCSVQSQDTQSQAMSCGYNVTNKEKIASSVNSEEQNTSALVSNIETQYNSSNQTISAEKSVPIIAPVQFIPTTTETNGHSWGGAQSTEHSEYHEQTISESFTNQYSDNWSTATAVDSTHAADLRFTYNIANNGTEYAREVTSLTFNIYIGSNPNPIETYVAINDVNKPKIQNLFPGESVTYTSEEIWLTLDEMRAIDEGAPIRIVMEDISFGQDQVFYQDAFNGSVLLAMEDGFDDGDETIDSYLIPVWDPNDTVQDVVKRYFPVTEDEQGNLLSISTPEFTSNPPTFEQHALTGTSWWNIYLSEGLNYTNSFKDTVAAPNSSVLIRIVTDSDLDGYNNRNEIRIGTDPNDPASHPAPIMVAGYTTSCTGNDCTVRMVFENLGNYDAYGVEAIMYSPDGQVNITNNTIGGSGRVNAGEKVIVSASDTFQYTKTVTSPKEPVIVVSYNDPQGNHRFILPASAALTTLNDNLTPLNGQMLPDPGVDIASTSATNANFVIFSPHAETITNGKLFVEYIDGQGNVMHEDVFTQDFASGPTVVPVSVDTGLYPPESTILLAFFTDSQGNIIDSSARPLASFGVDPLPEANLTTSDIEIGAQSVVDVPNPWNFGTVEPGTTLYATITLGNTGLGDLRYSLTGWGDGVNVMGIASGSLSASDTHPFAITIDTAGLPNGAFSKTLTLRTNDPNHASIAINLTGTIGTPAGTATAYQVNPYQPWNQFVYVPGPRNQNDIVNFTHTLADDPSRMFPLYLYDEDGTTLKGVGEYGVDFSGQTAPFGVFGTGADGDLTVTTGQTVYTDTTRSAVSTTANSGQPNITLSSAAGFAAGQEVLIIQMQGTGAGNYEFVNIASVSSNTLTLAKNLTSTYTIGGSSKAQVIRVRQYQNITVQSGGNLTANTWDGSTGGITAFRATGTVAVNSGGVINLSAKGYIGGTSSYGAAPGNGQHGKQGEGYTGPSGALVKSANGNGGGGGVGNEGGDGGGGGGNGTAGSPGGTRFSVDQGGSGGSVSGNATLTNMTLGGGGGSGGGEANSNSSSVSGAGGRGGGMIVIFARNITVSGGIYANGSNGGNATKVEEGSGGGGGGAGGSILIKSQTAQLGSNLIAATGGAGGAKGNSSGGAGNGGAGGAGRIRIEYGTVSGTTNPTANSQQVNFYSITGQGAPFGVFGNGSDGNLTVTTGQTVYTDNIRTSLGSTASTGQANITVASASGFTVGKEILIIQIQGTGAGSYEFAAITNVSGNTITLSKPLGNTYTTGGNSKAQVIVVPNYQNVTVQSGGVLTTHAWDGSTGGIVAFRASGTVTVTGTINANGKGFRGSNNSKFSGESYPGVGSQGTGANGGGGGGTGTEHKAGGGGGGYGTVGSAGTQQEGGSPGAGGSINGTDDLTTMNLGSAGGSGISVNPGGNGGGSIFIAGATVVTTGSISSNGSQGGPGDGNGGNGGGSGGSILIKTQIATLGTGLITATGAVGTSQSGIAPGGNGGFGRIRIEYSSSTGTTNPSASTQQVNYYNLTGSSSNTLYVPDTIGVGGFNRYKLLYGQRSLNTSGGDQFFTVYLENRQYSSVTMSALVEQVVGSTSPFNFCIDFGNDGACDYTANSQAFTGPVRLDSTDLASALNAYITGLGSAAPVLTIPIRVNINAQADVFLFNLSASPGADSDLLPTNFTITPPNDNPANNIPEGSQVTLSAMVQNNGTYKAENFTVAFYNGDPAADGVLIGSTFVQSLAAGATSPAQTVTWNTTGLLGSKTIYVKVDASGNVPESLETNNTTSSAAVIKKKADLQITSFIIPDVRQNETGTASVMVKNDGEADVTGAVIELYKGNPAPANLIGSTTVDIAQGVTTSGLVTFTLPNAGAQTITAKVDPANVVLEADETNNSAEGSTIVGWDKLTIDAGSGSDVAYSSANGAGHQSASSTVVTSCGTQIQQSYRQVGSADTLTYRFDNLLPGRYYHLDLTFATCSGDRYLDLFVDGTQVAEQQAVQLASASISPYQINSTPHTVSLLIDPASYATDRSIVLSIARNSGFNGPLVNIIDLQEIKYCYMDSGPSETPWSAQNTCGYDSTWSSDGFNGWGDTAYETIRFGTDSVKYKFSSLTPSQKYNLRMTYYEEDNTSRIQRVSFDGASFSVNTTLNSSPAYMIIPVPTSSYADGQVVVAFERPAGGEAIVSEVILEENTRLENGRYSAPSGGGTSTPPPPPPTSQPQVTVDAFTAVWQGAQIKVDWSTTTEINNSQFDLYRSTNTSGPWVLATVIASKHSCGTFTSTTPETYTYTDASVNTGTTYYYKLIFSGTDCGSGTMAYARTAQVDAPVSTILSITRASDNPTSASSVDFTVTFSGAVQNVDINDFDLTTTGGITGESVTSATGSGATRTITVNTGTGNGTIRLDVPISASIADLAGNPLSGLPYESGEVYSVNKSSGIIVNTGGALQGNYEMDPKTDLRVNYAGLNNGPMQIVGAANRDVVSSIRVLYKGKSYSEMLGYPADELTNEYWFPIYESNTTINSQIRVGNMGAQSTTISIYLGNGQLLDSFALGVNEAARKNYAGSNNGPLRIVSSATNILASMRYLQGDSYSEELGYPGNQLTTEYWFPWYNNNAFPSQLRVANTGNATANVTVYIGNNQVLDTFSLAVGEAVRKSYAGVNNGPLRVVTSGSTILPSIRVLYKGVSYSEMLGLPTAKLTNEYWFPVYDSNSANSQLRVGNVGNQSTTITVYLGDGQLLDTFTLAVGEAVRKNYASTDDGPLQVVSSTTNVLASVRILKVTTGFESYYELLAYPGNNLTDEVWFPWYNNSAFSSQLRIAVP